MTQASKARRKPSLTEPARRKPTFTELARRKQILEVSTELFREKGFESTSLDDIAQRVGVSRGVIFYYFDGKREIGEQAVRQFLRNYSAYVQARVHRKARAREQLLAFAGACLDYLEKNRGDYRLYMDLIGCFGTTDDKNDISVAANRSTRQWLVSLIKRGQEDGTIGELPANALADIIQGAVDGLLALSALEPDTVKLAGCKKLLATMIAQVIEPKAPKSR